MKNIIQQKTVNILALSCHVGKEVLPPQTETGDGKGERGNVGTNCFGLNGLGKSTISC
jgi:hypothetical protein